MSVIKRAISADGSVVASAVDATDIAAMIEQYHKPSAVVTAALGRLATAASLMWAVLWETARCPSSKTSG